MTFCQGSKNVDLHVTGRIRVELKFELSYYSSINANERVNPLIPLLTKWLIPFRAAISFLNIGTRTKQTFLQNYCIFMDED